MMHVMWDNPVVDKVDKSKYTILCYYDAMKLQQAAKPQEWISHNVPSPYFCGC